MFGFVFEMCWNTKNEVRVGVRAGINLEIKQEGTERAMSQADITGCTFPFFVFY